MCNLLSLTTELTELTRCFGIEQARFDYKPRHSIAPTQQLPVIRYDGGRRTLEQFRWGLMPFWAKDAVLTDSDSVIEKRAYRSLFAKQRCIVPCSAFYVYKTDGNKRRTMRTVLREKGVFGIAGLFDIWTDPRGNEHGTFTLMTTRANRLLFDFTPVMPAILKEDEIASWLDPGRNHDTDYLPTLLKPYHPDLMHSYPVTAGSGDADHDQEGREEAVPAAYALLKR